MVSVGFLAVLLNVTTLFIAVLAERAIERIMTTFAISRLKTTRRAPVVHDSDAWLFNFPRSIVKYYKYPAILFTLLCGFLLVVFEMVSELGVDTSNKCQALETEGHVIKTGGTRRYVARVNLVAMSSALQQIDFEDGEMKFLSAGFPKRLRSSVCISIPCLNVSEDRLILANCTTVKNDSFPPGRMQIGAQASSGPFFVTTTGFNLTSPTGQLEQAFRGDGDIVYGGLNCCAFLFSSVKKGETIETTYLEYAHQGHCSQLFANLSQSSFEGIVTETGTIWQKTRGPVHRTTITCARNMFSAGDFTAAIQAYRSIQLENVLMPAEYDVAAEEFQNITTDDIYRAGLSLKLAEVNFENGTYYTYTECGQYQWIFVMPLIIIIILIILLGAVATYQAMREPRISVPYNSRTWYDELVNKAHGTGRNLFKHGRDHSNNNNHHDNHNREEPTGGGGNEHSSEHIPVPRTFYSWKCDEMVLIGNEPDLVIDFSFGKGGVKKSESYLIKQAPFVDGVQEGDGEEEGESKKKYRTGRHGSTSICTSPTTEATDSEQSSPMSACSSIMKCSPNRVKINEGKNGGDNC